MEIYVRTGKSPHKGGDSVNGFVTKVIGNRLYIDPIPSTLGNKVYTPHKKYADLQNSVKNHLTHLDKDSRMPVDSNVLSWEYQQLTQMTRLLQKKHFRGGAKLCIRLCEE